MSMNSDFDNLLQNVFRVKALEEADVLSVEQLARQYPYFAPLQYVLAKKYRQLNHAAYGPQIAKTAVFFNNPHWLNDLLHADENTDHSEQHSPHITPGEPHSDDLSGKEEVVVTEEPVEIQEALPEREITGEGLISHTGEEQLDPEVTGRITESDENSIIATEIEQPSGDEDMVLVHGENNLPHTPPGEFHADDLQGKDDMVLPGEPVQIQEVLPERETPGEPLVSDSNGEKPDPGPPGLTGSDENGTPVVAASEVEPPSAQLVKPGRWSLSDPGNQPLIPIEPLYTIDYFASQGIKLDDEEGKDRLSQKLRSFTEWLKTMKRIHPEKLEQQMSNQTSAVVQNIAEHSNTAEDVITEAMAEVYARQGLRNKAAEVYQKLSLLNPDKRTYFAAKISKLNET